MKTRVGVIVGGVLALAGAIGAGGCGHSGSADAEVPGLTGADRQAESAAMAELQKHWVKAADGWTTSVVAGSPYAPDRFLRQCRALAIKEMEPQDLTESDKLNGFEWVGRANLKPTSCREAGGLGGMVLDGMSNTSRQRGRWSQWWISRRANALRKPKRGVAISVGWFVSARNTAGAAGICERRSAVGKSQKNRALRKITPGVLSLALGLLAARRFA